MSRQGDWPPDAARLLAALERHWHPVHSRAEVHRRLHRLLERVREILAQDGADARLVLESYRCMLRQQGQCPDLEAANHALRRLLASLGIAIAGILPLSFVTLPVLIALDRHFGSGLFGGEAPHSPGGHQEPGASGSAPPAANQDS